MLMCMASNPNHGRILALIQSVSTQISPDADRLADTLLSRCWPGGIGDRTETVALEWLSRWGPARVNTPRFQCACASGQCSVCN
jgi:hypothetical protein